MFNSLWFRASVSGRCLYNASCTVDNSIEIGHPYRAELDMYLNHRKQERKLRRCTLHLTPSSLYLTKWAEIVPQFPERTWPQREPTLYSQRMFNEERFAWSLRLSLVLTVVLLIEMIKSVVFQRWYGEHWWHASRLKMLYDPFETFCCFLWCCFLFQWHWWLFLDRKIFVKLWDESGQLNVSHSLWLLSSLVVRMSPSWRHREEGGFLLSRQTGWYRLCSQKALLDPANIILCGAHQGYSKVEITIVLLLSLRLLWFGSLWVFSVRCETLNALGLCSPAQTWRNPVSKQDLSLQSCLRSKVPASHNVLSPTAWNIVRGRICGGLLVIWLHYFSTTWAINI